MRKIWLLSLLLLSGCNNSLSYKEYTNVDYYYNENLTYVVEIKEDKYTLAIDNVYHVKQTDTRIWNKFYISGYVNTPNKLVLYDL